MNYRDVLETIKRQSVNFNGSCCGTQSHVHEFEASTEFAETGNDRHNHRFAGVTGEAIPIGNGQHVHKFCTRTDFVEEHYHEVIGTTCPNIQVSPNKHIHFIEGSTTVEDNHKHRFEFSTLTAPAP